MSEDIDEELKPIGLWSDEAFRRRVTERAAGLGKSVSEVCRNAGLAADYLKKIPVETGGRNVSAILQLAAVLKMDPADLMGLRPSVEIENRRAAAIAHVAAHLSLALGYVGTAPQDIDLTELTAKVVELIRRPKADKSQN